MWKEIKKSVVQIFKDLTAWFYDVFVGVVGLLLNAVASVIELIELPEFVTSATISDYLPESILYFLYMSKFGEALAMIGVAYGFRILRRFLTLGIW